MTLELDERLEVVGRARDGREAIELASALQPDVVLMALQMDVVDGLVHVSPAPQVVVLTSSTSAEDERRALDAGASAYVRKGGCSNELFDAVFAGTSREHSARRRERPASPTARPQRRLAGAASRALRAAL